MFAVKLLASNSTFIGELVKSCTLTIVEDFTRCRLAGPCLKCKACSKDDCLKEEHLLLDLEQQLYF
ncbi:hypothetical protein T10_13529 [Trichinella papuae]|uniref:Uncharacterized protein n=1 Tax=Trichinella papuae TaxID=268474 RepID=A0A0V1M390_9BILA|nr:hypothetical protein T10_13529 [Trichinella papuae]